MSSATGYWIIAVVLLLCGLLSPLPSGSGNRSSSRPKYAYPARMRVPYFVVRRLFCHGDAGSQAGSPDV